MGFGLDVGFGVARMATSIVTSSAVYDVVTKAVTKALPKLAKDATKIEKIERTIGVAAIGSACSAAVANYVDKDLESLQNCCSTLADSFKKGKNSEEEQINYEA